MVALPDEVKRRALAAAEALARVAPVRAAFLFGSYAQERADRWSDIDVAAFMDGIETWNLARQTRLIVKVQKEVGFDVEPHLFPSGALEHAQPGSFAAQILAHGVRIL